MTLRVHLDHEAEVVFISFCTVKLLFPCLFHTALFGKEVTACSSQLGGEKSCSSSSSVKYLHTLFEIFLLRKSLSLSLLMYIIMYLYPYGTVNIYSLLCIIIQYKLLLLLRLFQLWPQGAIYFGS